MSKHYILMRPNITLEIWPNIKPQLHPSVCLKCIQTLCPNISKRNAPNMSKLYAIHIISKPDAVHVSGPLIDPSSYMHPTSLAEAAWLATLPSLHVDSDNWGNLIKTRRLFSAVHKYSSCGDCQRPALPSSLFPMEENRFALLCQAGDRFNRSAAQSARCGDKPGDIMAAVYVLMTSSIRRTCARDVTNIADGAKETLRHRFGGKRSEVYCI